MTCAPGMHGATRSTSSSAVQTSSMGAATVKVLSNSMWVLAKLGRSATIPPGSPRSQPLDGTTEGPEHADHGLGQRRGAHPRGQTRLLLVHFLRGTPGARVAREGLDRDVQRFVAGGER